MSPLFTAYRIGDNLDMTADPVDNFKVMKKLSTGLWISGVEPSV